MNFNERRRTLSKAFNVLSRILCDEYDDDDMPVFYRISCVMKEAYQVAKSEFENWKDAETAAVTVAVLCSFKLVPMELIVIDEIDEEIRFLVMKIIGVKGQTAEERQICIDRSPIAKWVIDFTERLSEDHNQDRENHSRR